MDEQTADVIIQPQLEDAMIHYSAKEKSDGLLAVKLCEDEPESLASYYSDKWKVQSLAKSAQTRGQILTENIRLDGDAADRLTRPTVVPTGKSLENNSKSKLLCNESSTTLTTLNSLAPDAGRRVVHGGQLDCGSGGTLPLASIAGNPAKPKPPSSRCAACWEELESTNLVCIPCGHVYCRKCLEDLYRASMSDESLFPPQCCTQPIPIASVRNFFTAQFFLEFEEKKIEFETSNRTYCWSPKCSTFIVAENITGDVAICTKCGSKTCTLCKSAAHNADCPNDIALQQVLRTANEKGWQRCYSCRRLVELKDGCNHMICLCGFPFCYLCGLRWKTCQCPRWNEHQLLSGSEPTVQPLAPRRPPAIARMPIYRPFEENMPRSDRHSHRLDTNIDQWRNDTMFVTDSSTIGREYRRAEVPRATTTVANDFDNYVSSYANRNISLHRRAAVSTDPSYPRDAWTRSSNPLSKSMESSDSSVVVDEGRYTSMGTETTPRSHPLYQNVQCGSDGLYHCPWETKYPSCNHKPEKLRCNYDKLVDMHLKPYRCKALACGNARFSSTSCLLRHEREAHAMHGHWENPFLCSFEGCERGAPGNGFPRHWNLCDHMKRVHNRSPSQDSGRFKKLKHEGAKKQFQQHSY